MRDKIISYFIIGILVLSGLGAVAISNEETTNYTGIEKSSKLNIACSKFIEKNYNNEYIEIGLKDTASYLSNPGYPLLPKIVKVIDLPFGASNIDIKVTPNNIQVFQIDKKIRPGPAFVPLISINNVKSKLVKNKDVYSSDISYPNSWFQYRTTCGLNEDNKHVTHVIIETYPIKYNAFRNKINVVESFDVKLNYFDPEIDIFPALTDYDLVIIAPGKFENDLLRLINHKNSMDPPIRTTFMKTEDIYSNPDYDDGDSDKPEMIKYFIKDAIETWGIKYVLLVGGLDSLIYGVPRDNSNEGTKDWLVPVRYNNIYDNPKYPLANKTVFDPGVISDLYYEDIYKEGGIFEDWDPNGDGMICSWDKDGFVNDTGYGVPTQIDFDPDVSVGRLACRNKFEVRIMVDKIIKYETKTYGKDWFDRYLSISGDGFLDQEDLDIQWDTEGLSTGIYTIYAQSTNHQDPPVSGLIDTINVTLDKSQLTSIHFNHNDHLQISDYPGLPIAEIVSVSEDDTLGYNDTFYEPDERKAYCNQFLSWANVEYTDEVLYIRGKSYDPRPYGNITDIKVWINNSLGETVFTGYKNNTEMYYEGEWAVGEKLLKGGGGAFYYMPNDFYNDDLWPSNGLLTSQTDVINEYSQGSGFTFFSGHGSPNVWANHKPGVPGNRRNADITGLRIFDIWSGGPILPMNKLSNKYKTPITLVGGCHNSQFNVSLIPSILSHPSMWTYGSPTPECWSWWLTRLSKRGSLATIGNTGLGYGIIGKDCTTLGLDGGICIEFFKQYGTGKDILGDAYRQTQSNYVANFDMQLQEHGKTLTQWVLHGDPSLKIGGYDNIEEEVSIQVQQNGFDADGIPDVPVGMQAQTNGQGTPNSYEWSIDTDGDGEYDTTKTGENIEQIWDKPGVYWVKVKAIYDDFEEITETIVDIESSEFPNKPTKPSGKTSITGNRAYLYETSSTDPQENDLWYLFLWGDDEWDLVGPGESGDKAMKYHRYKEKGVYELKVMAINEFGYWSEWSDPLTIIVKKTKTFDISDHPLYLLIHRMLNTYPNMFPVLRQLAGL